MKKNLSDFTDFMTFTDLADLLPLGRDKVYKLMRSNSFPAIKIGKNYIVQKKDFIEWWENNKGKEFIL